MCQCLCEPANSIAPINCLISVCLSAAGNKCLKLVKVLSGRRELQLTGKEH